MSKKSTLDRIEIPKPCFADWERMVGSQNIRFCTECNKHVYNLSGMTRGEAEALVASAPKGRLCARLTRGADGTTLTADDQPSVQLIWRRASPIANVVVSAMLTMSTPGIASAAGINSDRSSIASVFDAPDPEAAPQGAVAALSGSTTDKQGHAIRGAKLMLINEDTGDTQTAVSSYDGTFRFFVLTNGLFTLSVEGAGLYKVEANGLNLGNGQEQRLDITMETIPDQVTLGGVMARPMNPLRKLYAESDLVVVARAGDSVKIKNDGESRFVRTSLSVSSTLKGEGSDPVVYVYQSVYGDEPGPFTRGEDLLIFLEHNRNGGAIKPIGGYELVDFQRSVKELSSSALDVYVQRINEL
ncbi:MAG TPA: carboxypeptidase-like regulatory domain-containing protein, partial [Blastocatellia bacterium]|nr:carboxypeptidase-like regulatory domain-containing protein [Blastocatellia bacterium]